MRKFVNCSIFALVACLATTQPASGQKAGGIIDWIHRLSGPSMLGPTVSYYWQAERVRFRVNGSARFPVGFKSKIDQEHSLNMLSLQPTLEIPLYRRIEVTAGLGLHRFGGSGHDAVYQISIPVLGQLRFPVNTSETLFLRFGMGGHYFPSFDDDAFDGGVDVKTDGGEITFTAILGFDYQPPLRSGG
jgi:hypothetical protein